MPRRIVLTGATRGLGRALVDRFVAAGHQVLGCGRSAAGVESLRADHGPPQDFAAVDISLTAAVDTWASRLLETGPAPDLIINNAGLMNRLAPLWEQDEAEFAALLDVNVKGTVNVIRAFLPTMIAAGRGVIANFSSGWGRSTAPELAPYCASKFAVEGLTRALAQELPVGLAAVAVNPGIIDTDMLRQCWAESAGAYPGAEAWSATAAEQLLGLAAKDNGRSVDLT